MRGILLDFGTVISTPSANLRFFVSREWESFSRGEFFHQKNKQFGKFFFEIREKLYKIWGEKQYNGHESFSLVEKIRFYASRGFCQENGLFLVSDCLQHFSDLGWVTFGLWQKIFNRFSKLCFFSVQSNFFRRKLLLRKINSLLNFHFRAVFISKVWWKKKIFGWKLSAQFWKLDSTLPDGLFEENYVLRKKISWKNILYFKQIFIFFCPFCSACLSKMRHSFQMNVFEEKFFSEQNLVRELFSEPKRSIENQNCLSTV